MTGQPWLAATFAVIMIGTAAYCLTRLAVSWRRLRPTDRHVDGMHVLMGVAMASMLVPRLRLMWTGGWEIIFAASAALFAWRVIRAARARGVCGRGVAGRGVADHGVPASGMRARCQSHDAQHLLGCGAMLYMLVSLAPHAVPIASPRSAAPGMLGPAPLESAVPLVLAVALLGCVVRTADRMSSLAPVIELAARQSGGAAGPGAAVGSAVAAAAAGGAGAVGPVPLSPRLSACCEIATGVTMGYMLITMLT